MSIFSAQQHPIGKKYRAMTPEEYSGLLNDIRDHGQRLQITMYQGMVLDGWHRMRACLELNKEPWTKEYSGADPEGYCKSLNDHRRHQSPTQRAAEAVDKKGTGALSQTAAEMAEASDTSERTIKHVKAADAAGFMLMMKAGEIDAKPAAELARKAPEVAARVVAKEITPEQGKAELQAKAKRELPTTPDADRLAELQAEKSKLEATLADKNAEIIALELAGVDEGARNEAMDKMQGYIDAIDNAERMRKAAEALLSEANYKAGELMRANSSLDAQNKKLKARIAELEKCAK